MSKTLKAANPLLAPVLVALLSGCAGLLQAGESENKSPLLGSYVRAGSYTQAARPKEAPHSDEDKASLWSDKSPFLFIDKRASRVGDIITVLISESSSASKKASTDLERESSLTAALSALLGYEEAIRAKNSRFNPDSALSMSTTNDFESDGTTSRSGQLTATISAKIVEVLPNGNMAIEGRREITVNEEEQIIKLTGVIRPEDIDPDNTIQSRFIADAKITYTGEGVLGDKQRPGWFARIFDIIWPF